MADNDHPRTLYVEGMPEHAKHADIEEIFLQYGPCKVDREGIFYVIVYDDWRDADDAFHDFITFDGEEVFCDYTKHEAYKQRINSLNDKYYSVRYKDGEYNSYDSSSEELEP